MSDPSTFPYDTHLDVRFGPLERVDVQALADAATHPWYNQTLCRVNDAVVRLGVVKGEYHWHHHDAEDEFFYVVEGELEIEVADRESFVLGPQQGVTIPRGVMHRPVARRRTVVLMVEPATVQPTGD